MKHGLCVIGYGGMGGWHINHALTSDAVEPMAVHDIKEERNLAAEEKGLRAYRSLDEVLADSAIELVTVAIPNNDHEKVAIACMKAGKHVICEKPVTLSVASLERMIAAANENGVRFSVHQNRRWDVDYLAVKKLMESGAIGEILDVESRIHGSRGIPSDWRGMKKHGGGMLYDWGSHLIDQILMLFADVKLKCVFCELDHVTNDEVDDGFRLTMRFENGARAYVEVGTSNFIAMPRFYIRGKRGTGLLADWREPCRVTECFAWHESEVMPVRTAAGLTKTMAPRDEITTRSYDMERPISDVHEYYRNFCAAIEGRQEQLVTHSQMLRVMRVIEAAFASADQNQPIFMKEEINRG